MYNPKEIEKKWQDKWEKEGCFHAENDSKKQKYYTLIEFPYPSGQGLHVGHPRSYTALDIVSRYKRMKGFNVLYPIGFDAFGLPTENFALKTSSHPATITKQNIANFTRQLKACGFSFDYSRVIDTTSPEYYKWTQFIFLQLFKKGLAYKSKIKANFCPSCKCTLSNEEVINNECERCGTEVTHKEKEQWMLAITKYADRLYNNLDKLDYPARVKEQQKNWIGKSEGAEIDFLVDLTENCDCGHEHTFKLKVYTTRPDTLFGVSFLAVCPEHDLVKLDKHTNKDEVQAYVDKALSLSDLDRQLSKDKSGCALENVFALHPITKEKLPIYIADYILPSYGTGAIMAVPAHDERDFEFAKLKNLPIIKVVTNKDDSVNVDEKAYTDTSDGILVNSDFLNNLSVNEAKKTIIDYLVKENLGNSKTNFKLRDWVFSRQRYWGEPIPIVHCSDCGMVALDEKDLPLMLPEIDKITLTDDGTSPLTLIDSFVNCKCPKCSKDAKRETDTMPQWAGSSWYFLRYMDPHNNDELASENALNYWGQVDWYNGGMEHTTLHLLYSRFWNMFLYDIGIAKHEEPYKKRTSHGMILGEDNQKMSKSRGNVVNPDDVIDTYGADTLRVYEMFIGDFEKTAPWSESGIKGSRRFVERFYNLMDILEDGAIRDTLKASFHKTIKKVEEDILNLKFNTAIAALMSLINEIYDSKKITKDELIAFTKMMNLFAPHAAEEVWEKCNLGKNFVCLESYPEYDESLTKESEIEIAVQINGKIKAKIMIDASFECEQALNFIKENDTIKAELEGKQIVKQVYVKGRLANFVVK